MTRVIAVVAKYLSRSKLMMSYSLYHATQSLGETTVNMVIDWVHTVLGKCFEAPNFHRKNSLPLKVLEMIHTGPLQVLDFKRESVKI
jgi:hypothetical protein